MRKVLRTASIAAALVGAAVIGLPISAAASSIYPPTDACSVDPTTIAPGGTVVFSCSEGTFGSSEPVTVTITGENGAGATLGFVKFAISTASYNTTSAEGGELPGVSITLPSNATGVYNIAAVSPSSAGGISSVTITGDDGEALPGTGGDPAAVALWAGGGLLLLASGAVAIAVARRRNSSR